MLIFWKLDIRKTITLIPLILLFAIFDEFHQKFIPGREVEFADLGFNVIGILSGWLISLPKGRRGGENENI